ncbi:transglycosylase domain-containing protein [Desulfotomaculum sp. 1211_IL3151]|uniref:transglycosylase domain-containing protein n=1 Tax=Desulfotomaculum sp. 1211_IL3151 TaxID=3084055 RepID=UPI002FDB39E5
MDQEQLDLKQDTKALNWHGRKKIRLIIAGVLSFLLLSFSFWIYYEYNRVSNLYSMDTFDYQTSKRGVIYSADGVVLTYLFDQNKEHVTLDKISKPMQRTIMAIEDHRFYRHHGVDIIGTVRALLTNIFSGEASQGGSTITQQLARNLFLSPEKTLSRKFTELLLAIKLESKFSKEEILEMYLNEIYFGNGCYGIETAANKYFNKQASEISFAEATVLAGIPKAPSQLEPIYHHRENRDRQIIIINRLLDLGYINKYEAQQLVNEKIDIKNTKLKPNREYYKFPYFTSEVIQQLIVMYGKDRVYNGGLRVATTLDTKAAEIAEVIAKNKVAQFKTSGIAAQNMSFVSVNNRDGAVISLVGGVDFTTDQNNLAVLPRQPGSAIKPLHYAGALDQGIINENKIFHAGPRSFGNYFVSSNTKANVSVCVALKHSMNVPAVEVVSSFGIKAVLENLKNFGITTLSEKDSNLAIALGGMYYGIKPIELAAAYAAFANSGIYNKPYLIKTVEDKNGHVLYQHKAENRQIIKPRTAQIITQILVEVVRGGTGTRANISGNEAGKTGTTDDSRCLWFVGLNKDISTAIWIGNNDNRPVYGYHGGDLAAPIWREYITTLMENNIINKPAPIYSTYIPLKQEYITPKPIEENPKPEAEVPRENPNPEHNNHPLPNNQDTNNTTATPEQDNNSMPSYLPSTDSNNEQRNQDATVNQ